MKINHNSRMVFRLSRNLEKHILARALKYNVSVSKLIRMYVLHCMVESPDDTEFMEYAKSINETEREEIFDAPIKKHLYKSFLIRNVEMKIFKMLRSGCTNEDINIFVDAVIIKAKKLYKINIVESLQEIKNNVSNEKFMSMKRARIRMIAYDEEGNINDYANQNF